MPISIDKFPVPVSILAIHFASIVNNSVWWRYRGAEKAVNNRWQRQLQRPSCSSRGPRKKPVPSVFGDFFLWTAARMLFFKADLSFRLKIYLTRTHVKGGDSMPSSVESRVRGARWVWTVERVQELMTNDERRAASVRPVLIYDSATPLGVGDECSRPKIASIARFAYRLLLTADSVGYCAGRDNLWRLCFVAINGGRCTGCRVFDAANRLIEADHTKCKSSGILTTWD